MNLWIVKLSSPGFSKQEHKQICKCINEKNGHDFELNEHKIPGIHLVSFVHADNNFKHNYHHLHNQTHTAYSGILVDPLQSHNDYRDAKTISNSSASISDLANELTGRFALLTIRENFFQCVVDSLGMYKVYYYTGPNQTYYISNYLPFIQSVKEREIQTDFLINFIVNSGTYGYKTIEKDVYTIQESGNLSWKPQSGLSVESYQKLDDFFCPPADNPVPYVTDQFFNSSAYLLKHYNLLIPLSGGYDSRTIMNMFWNQAKENIIAYSYPDNPYDLPIAKKLTRKYGLRHIELKPKAHPSIDELHAFAMRSYPFVCYSSVFRFLFNEQSQKQLYNSPIIELWGNGGDTDLGLYKFGNLENLTPRIAVETLARKLINKEILTGEGFEVSCNNFIDHYLKKYSPLFGKVENFNLSTAHFIFERFASYQGHKYSESLYNGTTIFHLPYASKPFIQLIFSSDSDQLIRRKKGSIHHQLSNALTNKNAPHIPFTSSLHWNATKSDKAKYYLKRDYIDPVLKKMNLMNDKYSNQARLAFMNRYSDHFREVVHSYPKSELWDHIDHEKVKLLIENPKTLKKSMKLLFRIVPLLKEKF